MLFFALAHTKILDIPKDWIDRGNLCRVYKLAMYSRGKKCIRCQGSVQINKLTN